MRRGLRERAAAWRCEGGEWGGLDGAGEKREVVGGLVVGLRREGRGLGWVTKGGEWLAEGPRGQEG